MPKPELLAALPALDRTRELTRALAVLDAVMSGSEEYRHYAFDAAWDEGEAMASMNNGSGDLWFCWFGPPGAAIVGFDHESDMSPYREDPPALWPGLLSGVPEAFRAPVLDEPAFEARTDSTFVIWREPGDARWQAGDVELPDQADPDGAVYLLAPLAADDPAWYVEFAAGYHEEEVDPQAVAAIYRGESLTAALIARLNPLRDTEDALAEAAEMGYPTA